MASIVNTKTLCKTIVEDFNPAHCLTSSLIINVEHARLAYTVYHNGENQYQYLKTHSFVSGKDGIDLVTNLKRILEDDEKLTQPYATTRIVWPSSGLVLIPNALFDASKAVDYLKLNLLDVSEQAILTEQFPKLDATGVYVVPKSLIALLNDRLKKYAIKPSAVNLFRAFKNYGIKASGSNLFLNITHHSFDAFAFEAGAFKLFNNYRYHNTDEAVYYIGAICQQLGFDQENTQLHLTGAVDTKSSLLKEIQSFFDKVHLLQDHKSWNMSKSFSKSKANKHFCLFSSMK